MKHFYFPVGPNCLLTLALIEKGLRDGGFRAEHLPFDWNGFGLGNLYSIIDNDYQNVWHDMVVGDIELLSYDTIVSGINVRAHRILDTKYGLIAAHDLLEGMHPSKVVNKYNKRFDTLVNKLITFDEVTLVYEPDINLTYSTYDDNRKFYPTHDIMEYLDTSKNIDDVAQLIINKYNIGVKTATIEEL